MLTVAISLLIFVSNINFIACIGVFKSKVESTVVFGGSGGVGQLISQSLLQTKRFKVSVVTRDVSATSKFDSLKGCDIMSGDALVPSSIESVLKDVDNIVISVGTTAFPTAKWKNNNTPERACLETVKNILDIARYQSKQLKRVCLISSVGVERTDMMPYKLLNSYGVLDAKLASEKVVRENSKSMKYEAIIVRPGRLVGEPFTNFDLAKLFGITQGKNQGIIITAEDNLNGDVERADVATAVTKIMTTPPKIGYERVFTIINKEGSPPSDAEWKNLLQL